MIQMRRLLLGVCLSVLLPCAVRAEWGFDTTAAFAYDDNASNAIEAEDRKADSALTLNVNGGTSQQLGASTRVTLGVVAVLVTLIAFSLRDTLSADRAEIIDALSRFVERLTGFFRR